MDEKDKSCESQSSGSAQEMSELSEDAPKGREESRNKLLYCIEDVPPWYTTIFLGLQQFLTMVGGSLTIPFILFPKLCIEEDDPARGYIISTVFFISGLITLMQTTVGVRLPIVQGGSFAYLVPILAILKLPENQCPADFAQNGWGNMTYEDKTEEWQKRMRVIQGSVAVASVFQVIVGYFGIVGIILRYLTPLTIAPAVSMIGLSLFHAASDMGEKNWAAYIGTISVMILFSQYLVGVHIPWLSWKGRRVTMSRLQIFRLFPVLLTVTSMWGLCALLTVSGALSETSTLRTDLRSDLLAKAAWIRIPYPFQWGIPVVTVSGVFGVMAGVLASVVESIGDYYTCARISGAPPPPAHAINRGIGTEGLGCVLAGLFGSGNGSTSFAENIGVIAVTKVGSRRVIQACGVILVLFGLLSKVGALFITIPTPIIGGIFTIMFSMITAVGLSNLQFVDLNSSRNLFILGFALFFGLMMPQWVRDNAEAFDTGSEILDQLLIVLLETSMFVAGLIGFILDNTIPGTKQERGLVAWEAEFSQIGTEANTGSSGYDIPFVTAPLRRQKWSRYLPMLPTYEPEVFRRKSKEERSHL